jgi:cytochrome b involved in lipid metabolism
VTSDIRAPSQTFIARAGALNAQLGHENLGFVSPTHGLAPAEAPLTTLPLSHRDWDEVAARLPELFSSLRLRDAFLDLPLLHADEAHLADRYLLRAAAVLSILAHSWVRVQPADPAPVPATIRVPWEDVTRRLRRPRPFLSYIDLIVYNWRLRDPSRPDPMRIENMDLLLPTVGNEEERIFYLTQVEILAQCTPAVIAAAEAQSAVLRRDDDALIDALLVITERLQHVAEVSFQKISPNPYSPTYVDPVVWAKTVAPFAVPIDEGVAGPSGTASPLFHVLDLFFSRPGYESLLGHEMLKLRGWYPVHWVELLEGLGAVSVSDYVRESANRELQGVFLAALDAYASDKGFLGTHRLKVYGYLEMAFKVGRSVTIGGFKGLFQDRTWDEIDGELAQSRTERLRGLPPHTFLGLPRQHALSDDAASAARPVSFDIEGAGVRYRAGDRAGMLPENDAALVGRMLEVLQATGDERVTLDSQWCAAMRSRHGYEDAEHLPLRTLLRFGKLRPVTRDVAQRLLAMTANSRLRRIVHARSEDQWELPDLLAMLLEAGLDARQLWRAEPWERESICRIVPPERARLYSISSAMSLEAERSTGHIDLTVAPLTYRTRASDLSPEAMQSGTGSAFLQRVSDPASGRPRPVSLRVVPAPKFHLPADATRPVVMFAGGAGIAPFRGFMQQRMRDDHGGENWLFIGARSLEQLPYRDELQEWVAAGRLNVQVAFSGAELSAYSYAGNMVVEPGQRRRLTALVEDERVAVALRTLLCGTEQGGAGAYCYICGRAEFASDLLDALHGILAREGGDEQARATIARLVAEGRLLLDVFTSYTGSYQSGIQRFDASEVVLHNNDAQGYWMVVNGRVYDVTRFVQLHPGGPRIIRQYAGIDATAAYRAVLHDTNPEVDSQLAMYAIGVIRRLDFGGVWGVAIGEQGLFYASLEDAFRAWVSMLYLIVEMENALINDFDVINQPLTQGDDAAPLTPLKVQLTIDAHRRFFTSYLGGLTGNDMQRLWALTSGLCRRDADVRAMREHLDAIDASEDARAVRELPEALWHAATRELRRTRNVEHLANLCALLEHHDRRLLADLKTLVRGGVRLFEQHEARTLDAAGKALYSTALAIPDALERYYTDLARALHKAAEALTPIGPDDVTRPAIPTPTRFPGHGSAFRLDDSGTLVLVDDMAE